MKRTTLIAVTVALAAAAGGYFAAMLFERAQSQPQPLVSAQAMPGPADLVGQRRPDFSLQDMTGRTVGAADFDGQVWLLNFWASWCTPCVQEMPMLSALHRGREGAGLTVVGIAVDEPQRAREFAAELGIDYPVLVGLAETALLGRRYGNRDGVLPYSVLIDAAGTVRWTHLGALDRDILQAQAAKLR